MGRRLGRYELVRLVGRGGSGEVWEAILHGPAGFQKRVAVKRLDDQTDALVHEARLGGLLQHANLVEVYALEQVDGTWIAAMELCTGGSLARLIPLHPRAVLDAGIQAAAGLAHAHREVGLVHLDLKPQNLLIHHGQVKVADLGIARAHGFAHDGSIRGTPAYMAPEHLAGQAVDPRADIYALGVVLIELVTGQADANPARVPWLAPVLERCLAPDPEDRFRSMGELAAALREIDLPGPTLAELLGHQAAPRARVAETSGFTFTVDVLAEPKPSTNLPADQGVFVGRQDAEGRLLEWLDAPGLITVRGAGGLGKTRLARRVARAWHGEQHAPAWFVDLAPAREVDDVVRQVAAVLEIPLAREADAEHVELALAGRGPLVLVLDNFEQVLDAASLVERWRRGAPEVRFLVTSQAPLQVPGERIFALETLDRNEGAALLKALADQRGVEAGELEPLRQLSDRLDGLPLALELAAGRLGVLSARGILDRLDERFRLLRAKGKIERHATLERTLDWSYELLGPEEREAFAQCAVFAGAFDVPAAEAVIQAGDTWALDLIDALLDRSLIHRRGDQLVVYESARAYAHPRLEDREAEVRHGRHYATYGTREAERQIRSRDAGVWRRRLAAVLDELVVACERAIERGDRDVAVNCGLAAASVFGEQGPMNAGLSLVDRVLAMADLRIEQRLRLENRAAWLLHKAGRPNEGLERVVPAIELAESSGNARFEANLRGFRAAYHLARGDADSSREQALLAREIFGRIGDRFGVADTDYDLGVLESVAGRVDSARQLYEKALEGYRAVGGWPYEGRVLAQLGLLAHGKGDSDVALPLLQSSLAIHREVGNRRMEAACVGHLGLVHFDAGHVDEARGAFRAAMRQAREIGDLRFEAIYEAVLGQLEGASGNPVAAMRLLESASERMSAIGNRRDQAVVHGLMARQLLRDGDVERALDLLEAAEPDVGALSQSHGLIVGWRGEARVLVGRTREGLDDLDDAIAALREGSWRREVIQVELGRARALAFLGRMDEARDALAQAEQAVGEVGDGPGSPTWAELEAARRAIPG